MLKSQYRKVNLPSTIRRYDMAKTKDKKLKKLQEHHDYLNRKVDDLTKERLKDRSSESKALLVRLKKTKLAIKDAINRAKTNLGLTNK